MGSVVLMSAGTVQVECGSRGDSALAYSGSVSWCPLIGIYDIIVYPTQVVNCSTPANYFHVLRRQIAMPFRKPVSVCVYVCMCVCVCVCSKCIHMT